MMREPEASKQAKKSCSIIITSQQIFVTLNSDMNSANKAIHHMETKFVLMSLVLPRYHIWGNFRGTKILRLITGSQKYNHECVMTLIVVSWSLVRGQHLLKMSGILKYFK